jgi:hypothetical protein
MTCPHCGQPVKKKTNLTFPIAVLAWIAVTAGVLATPSEAKGASLIGVGAVFAVFARIAQAAER